MNYSNLYLLDVSPFVHAGRVNKYARFEKLVEEDVSWKTQVTPAGGVSLIFNTLYDICGTGDIIACCDRNPTIKKEMYEGYKATRDHKLEVEINKQVAEYILDQCGITTVAFAGYEADDIIYTYVKKLYSLYDKIYIYTGDSDLYFLVDDKVEIRPSSSVAKEVTKENFEKITIHGSKWYYNTLTVDKVVNGDASDNIPPLQPGLREIARDVFFSSKVNYEHYGDKDFCMLYADGYPDIQARIDLIWPLVVDDVPLDISTPDMQAIKNWGDAMHNKLFKGKMSSDFDVEEEVDKMQTLGMYLEDVL